MRRLNKLVQGRIKATGYHSAANVDKINKRIDDKVNAKMANFAAAFKAALDAGAVDSGATASSVGSNETAANVADKFTSNTSSNHDAILSTLKTIRDRLDKVEKGGGGGRRRGHAGANKDASTQAAGNGRKPCVNCGKRHKIPNEKCWALEANKDERPVNYVKPPSGLNKGN